MDFEHALAEHQDAVYRQMLRTCGNYDDAEDALAETLLAAYRHYESLERPEAMRAWLMQIGRRACGRLKKKRGMEVLMQMASEGEDGLDPSSPDPTPAELAWEGQMRSCLEDSLAALPEEQRRAYELVELDQMALKEAAKAEGISLAALKSRLHRARLALRESVNETVCASAL